HSHALGERQREAAARDPPAALGVDQLVVVVPGGADAGLVVAVQHEGVHVGTSAHTVAAVRHHHVGDAVHRVTARRVGLLHPGGDGVGAVPHADVAVVGHAVLGEARPEQDPVAAIDT